MTGTVVKKLRPPSGGRSICVQGSPLLFLRPLVEHILHTELHGPAGRRADVVFERAGEPFTVVKRESESGSPVVGCRRFFRHFQELVFNTVIQRNVKLSEAPSYGVPTILYDAESTGAKNHLALAKEIINRNK